MTLKIDLCCQRSVYGQWQSGKFFWDTASDQTKFHVSLKCGIQYL